MVAIRSGSKGQQVVAIGEEAKAMLGRTPADTQVIRPIRNGVIADFGASEMLLRALLASTRGRSLIKPRMMVCVPSETTEVERRAVQESVRAAGGREVHLVTTSMAAAIGANLPVTDAVGSMVMDVGGGRTEVAVVSLGGLVVRRSGHFAGDAMDDAISAWLRRHHQVIVGATTAEAVKLQVGCAGQTHQVTQMRIRGRDLATGGPREVTVTSTDIANALGDIVSQIRRILLEALQATPPELSADIIDRGILLCGGAAQLPGLDAVLREATGLPVLPTEDPMASVARGAENLLADPDLFQRVTAHL
jgi:rod shape-determining protein MreB